MSHYSETHYRNGEPYLGDTPIRRRWPAGATRRPSPDGRMSDRGNMNARIHVTDNRTPRVIPNRSGTAQRNFAGDISVYDRISQYPAWRS